MNLGTSHLSLSRRHVLLLTLPDNVIQCELEVVGAPTTGAGVLELLLDVVGTGVLELLLDVVGAGVLELLLDVVGAGVQSVAASLAAGELDPEGQSLHDPAPVDDLYLPTEHAKHGPPSGPVKPALHRQSDTASLAAGELELAGHVVQMHGSLLERYLPASQALHAVCT